MPLITPQETTPSQHSEAKSESSIEIAAELFNAYLETILDKGRVYTYELPRESMARFYSRDGMVRESLKALVKAGNSFYGIVETRVGHGRDKKYATILTKHVPGEQAELVCSIPTESAYAVGRRSTKTIDASVSGEHFAVTAVDYGDVTELQIADRDSLNGTKLYTLHDNRGPEDPLDIPPPIRSPRFWKIDEKEVIELASSK